MKLGFCVILLAILLTILSCSNQELFSAKTCSSKYDRVIQTFYAIDRIPPKVDENWKTYASTLSRLVMDDLQCRSFLQHQYGIWAVDRFDSIQSGAHKADVFRYAWLYKMGGIYADIKTVLLTDIHTIFRDSDICYMVATENQNRIYNGLIATPPNNLIMYKLFIGATTYRDDISDYLYNCSQGFQVLKSYIIDEPVYGLNKTSFAVPDVYLLKEMEMELSVCNGPDRYGSCWFICDGNTKVFKTRYNDYPW